MKLSFQQRCEAEEIYAAMANSENLESFAFEMVALRSLVSYVATYLRSREDSMQRGSLSPEESYFLEKSKELGL